jgi:hypothetical protein
MPSVRLKRDGRAVVSHRLGFREGGRSSQFKAGVATFFGLSAGILGKRAASEATSRRKRSYFISPGEVNPGFDYDRPARAERGPSARENRLVTATLLVAGFVGLLIFVFLEVMLLAVVVVTRMICLTLAHTLLIRLVLGVIRVLGADDASTDTHTRR